MLSLFPRDVLDEILDLIESVSEGFPTSSFLLFVLLITLFKPDTVLGYYANSTDPVLTPPNAASDQGLHYLLTEISMETAVE